MWGKKCDTSGAMESIPEGEYNLLQSVSKHKPIHVKLTDSCFKAFENYVGSGSNAAISLQFSEGQGKLVIPTSSNKPQVFSFYTTHLKTELECYKHDISGVEFLNLGGIVEKLTIRANEESYSTTREKMNMVKEQEQKSTTKVLKSIGKSSRKSRKHMPMAMKRSMMTSSEHTTTTMPSTNKYRSELQKFATATAKTERSNQVMTNNMYRNTETLTDRKPTKPTTMSAVKKSVVSSEHANRYKSAISATNEEPTPKRSNSLPKELEENTIHLLSVNPLTFTDLFVKISSIAKQPNRGDLHEVLNVVATVDYSNPQRLLYNLKETYMPKINVDCPKVSAKQKSSVQARLIENGTKGQKRSSSELSEVDVDSILNEVDSGVQDYSVSGKKKRVSLVKKNVVGKRDAIAIAPQPTKKPKEKKKKVKSSKKKSTAEAMPHCPATKPPQSLSNKEKTPITADSTTERIFHPQPPTENTSDFPDLSIEKPATNKIRFVKASDHGGGVLSSEGSKDQIDLQDKTALKDPLRPFSEPNMNGGDRKKRPKWKVTRHSGSAELNLTLSFSAKKKRVSASAQSSDQQHCGDLIDSFDNVSSMSQDGQRKSSSSSHYKSTTPSNDENSQDSYHYDDFVAKFTAITGKSQRDEYYASFQELYSLYKQLYVNVSSYTRRFDEYKQQYKRGSQCKSELNRAVWKDYRLLKSDKDFVEKKKKVEHMHSKLQHIKQLVHVYDTTMG